MSNGIDGSDPSAAGGRSEPDRSGYRVPPRSDDPSMTSYDADWWADAGPARSRRPERSSGAARDVADRSQTVQPAGRRDSGDWYEVRQGYATVVGQARGITQRQESYGDNQSSTVLTFRLERYDTDGNRLRPVPVQMRTIGFDGALGDGDEILVSGQWKDGTLHSQRMENLTTGGAVKGRSIKKMLLICLAALVAMAVVIGGFAIYSEHSQTQNFCEQAAHEGIRPPMC